MIAEHIEKNKIKLLLSLVVNIIHTSVLSDMIFETNKIQNITIAM